jgi:transcriptional regulator with XRE-family HTH domain
MTNFYPILEYFSSFLTIKLYFVTFVVNNETRFSYKNKRVMQIGNKIKSFRVEKGLSSVQVADLLGISESTYRRYETDKNYPDVNLLDKMAQLFEKPIYEFFPEQIQQHNHQQAGGVAIAYHSSIQQLSEKLTGVYEERIKELKIQVEYWKNKFEKAQ